MQKPELLLPVGNVESFYAALEGGADAIYLGLKAFNARGRAANFTPAQLNAILQIARKKGVKVYVTLNTVIKNTELNDLLDTLFFLSQTSVTAVIIQDWGTYYLLKQFFPKLVIHASTQMANHNSAGTNFSKKVGFNRVILARELTWPELQLIQKRSAIEIEIFVHGALCYSFSGMCHFSSYLGGAGANRGLCTQPCRRFYNQQGKKQPFFSLKDNQLIEYVPRFAEIGIASLKIEGRIKSGEYVFQVAQAYRQALDKPNATSGFSVAIDDLSRPKTQYFFGKTLNGSFTSDPNTGVILGKIIENRDGNVSFTSNIKLAKGNRLRFRSDNDSGQNAFILDHFQFDGHQTYSLKGLPEKLPVGTDIYLTAYREKRFNNTLEVSSDSAILKMPQQQKKVVIQKIRKTPANQKPGLWLRVDSLDWLKVSGIDRFQILILSLPFSQWPQMLKQKEFLKQHASKIWVELPGFISEKRLYWVKNQCSELSDNGFNRFVVSHLSQIELLPKNSRFATNEWIYAYNDAAIQFINSQGAQWMINPVENEYENMLTGAFRGQVIPVYYYPRLFYSRMPVKINQKTFTDERKTRYNKKVINGMTIIIPEKPVSITQYINKLSNKGFNRFMVDLSFTQPNPAILNEILKKIKTSESIPETSAFNFKKGLR